MVSDARERDGDVRGRRHASLGATNGASSCRTVAAVLVPAPFVSIRLYFDVDGISYRVHDTVYTKRKHTIVSLGHPKAHYRAFVTKDGAQQLYQFTKNDAYAVTEELLAKLRGGGYPARESFDA